MMKHLWRKRKNSSSKRRYPSVISQTGDTRLLLEALESRVLLSVIEHLRITEIMYHPADPTQQESSEGYDDDGDFEYIELQNIGSVTLDLTNVQFVEVDVNADVVPPIPPDLQGIVFNFATGDVTSLAPGEFVLVVRDEDAFMERYSDVPESKIAGEYDGGLSNGGERITLKYGPGANDIIQQFDYNDNWYPVTDGSNPNDPDDPDDPVRMEVFSLTIIDATNPDLDLWDDKDGWWPSTQANGTPGEGDSFERLMVINEVLAHSNDASPDWIEIYNVTSDPVSIGGWFLSDDNDNLKKYKIADGTVLPAGGYLVFDETTHFGNEADPGTIRAFGLLEHGDEVYLSSAENDILTGYFEERTFGASMVNVSFGRYEKSTDTFNFVAMSANTPGFANADPLVGPVVISEIMYNPLDPTAQELASNPQLNNDDFEYVKLSNITGLPVNMREFIYDEYGDAYVGWQFTRGIDFEFSNTADTIIPAFGSIIIAKNLDAFELRYGEMPSDVQVMGPFANDTNLSNNGERVEISRPGGILEVVTVTEDDFGNEIEITTYERMYIRVDRVNYNDLSPWPSEPDGPNGDGSALVRIDNNEYGNDPINWRAGPVLNFPPSIASLSDAPDPVSQDKSLTLTANSVSDFNDMVNLVEFYRDDGDGIFDANTDQLLGTDVSSISGWSWTGSMTGFALGSHRFFARAQDTHGAWSTVVQTVCTVIEPNELPFISSLTVAPETVELGDSLTITANGVTDSDGTVTRVRFYRDVNDNNALDVVFDDLLITDSNDADGWGGSVSSSNFSPGTNLLLVQAQDNRGAWGNVVINTVNVTVSNALPTISSLWADPDPVVQGQNLTLTAENVDDSDGSVTKVEFYRDANNNDTLEVDTDTLLGTDSNIAGGWLWSGSTATFELGTNDYFARAQDNQGDWGNAVQTSSVVEEPNELPTIGSLTVAPDPVVQGDNLTLTALNVADNDGSVVKVEFYRDANNNDTLDVGVDIPLGADTNAAGGWSWTGLTVVFDLGVNDYFARAQDDKGAWSTIAHTSSVVEEPNQLPSISSLSANPNPVNQGSNLALTANNVSDSDGAVVQVTFYHDANSNESLDIGIDTLLGTDIDESDGWSWIADTSSFALGGNYFFARARDNEGDHSNVAEVEVEVEVFFVTTENQTVRYTDKNGAEVTVKVANGIANLYFDGLDLGKEINGKTITVVGGSTNLQNIIFWDSNDKTSLTISAKGGEQIILGGLRGQALSKFYGKMVEITGDIDLSANLGSMTVDSIAAGVSIEASASGRGFSLKANEIGDDVSFDINGLVKSFQTNTFIGGALTADVISKVTVKTGDLGADLVSTVGEIGTVSATVHINGDIDSATFIKKITSKAGGIGEEAYIIARAGDIQGITAAQDIAGHISAASLIKKITTKSGNFTGVARAGTEISSLSAAGLDSAILSAANTIKKVSIKGDILDSYILGGYDIGPDCQFSHLEPLGDDSLPGGDVLSVSATGQFARSFIAAGTLPSSAATDYLPSVGVPADFGSIGKVKFASIDPDPDFIYGLFAVTEIDPFKIGKEPAVSDDFFKIQLVSTG